MAGFRHNIHPNIKQGLDARVKAMSEYAGQELRSSLLAESQANRQILRDFMRKSQSTFAQSSGLT